MSGFFGAVFEWLRRRRTAADRTSRAPDPAHAALLEDLEAREIAIRAMTGRHLQLDAAPARFEPLSKQLRRRRHSPASYVKTLQSLAEHFISTGRPASAARAACVAIAVGRRATPPLHVGPLIPYYLDASIAAGVTKIDDADSYLSELTPGVAALYRSRLAAASGETIEAFTWANRAVELLEPEGLTPALMFTHHHLANLHAQTGDEAGASRAAQRGIDGAEAALRNVPYTDRAHVRAFIDDTARLLILLAFQTQKGGTWETIDAAERTRARSLLEQLAEDFLPQSDALPEDLRDAESWQLGVLRTTKRLTRHASPTARERFSVINESTLRAELWDLLDAFPAEYAAYVRLRKGIPLPAKTAVALLHARHPRTHTFLFKKCGDRFARWWIDDNGAIRDSVLLDVRADELHAKAEQFTRHCATPYSEVAGDANALRQALFGTTLDHIPEEGTIVVVPSGILWNVPFCSLALRGQYLVERFSLCLLPCLSVAAYWDPWQPNTEALILGDSRGDLPSAAQEARAVGKLLRGQVLLMTDVNRLQVEQQIASSGFIHVACHAISDATVPGFSGIYLTDGTLLSAADMAASRLNCALMFLSGCRTGRVEMVQHDDPITIGTGAMRAGAKAVVYSLWEINDLVTRDFATRFYREMLGGGTLDTSLRAAQRSVLQRRRYAHPFFWGAFQLMGAMHPAAARSIRK